MDFHRHFLSIILAVSIPFLASAEPSDWQKEQARQARARVLAEILDPYGKAGKSASPEAKLTALTELVGLIKTEIQYPSSSQPFSPNLATVEHQYILVHVLKSGTDTMKQLALGALQKSRSAGDALEILKLSSDPSQGWSPQLKDTAMLTVSSILKDHYNVAPKGTGYTDDVGRFRTQEEIDGKVVELLLQIRDHETGTRHTLARGLLRTPDLLIAAVSYSNGYNGRKNLVLQMAQDPGAPSMIQRLHVLIQEGSPQSKHISYHQGILVNLLLYDLFQYRTPTVVNRLIESISKHQAFSNEIAEILFDNGNRNYAFLRALLSSSLKAYQYGERDAVTGTPQMVETWQAEVGVTPFREIVERILLQELNLSYMDHSVVLEGLNRLGATGGVPKTVTTEIARKWSRLVDRIGANAHYESNRNPRFGDKRLREVLAKNGVDQRQLDEIGLKLRIREILSAEARYPRASYRSQEDARRTGRPHLYGVRNNAQRAYENLCRILGM